MACRMGAAALRLSGSISRGALMDLVSVSGMGFNFISVSGSGTGFCRNVRCGVTGSVGLPEEEPGRVGARSAGEPVVAGLDVDGL